MPVMGAVERSQSGRSGWWRKGRCMEADRGLVPAFGWSICLVIAVSVAGSAVVAAAIPESDAILLFVTMLVGFGLLLVISWASLAVYVEIRTGWRNAG